MIKRPKILVVDDSMVILEGTYLTLQSFDVDVDRATNGQQALELIRSSEYAAVIMDCYMPECDGFDCTKTIREWESGSDKRLPIIGCSSDSDEEMRQRCLAAGMDDLLSKPSSFDDLKLLMEKWL